MARTNTNTGGGGGGAFSSITGTPTTIAYFDALGNGTGDLDHTLLADGTLRLTSTFGDVTGNYFQLLNPGVGNVGTWGVSAANNVTNSNFVQSIVDGTNIPDVGNDTAFLTSAQFPNTGVEYTELIASQGWVMGVAGDTWQGNQQLLSTGWEMNFDDGTSGGKLQIITGGIGITATDLSSSTTGYSVDAAFSSIFADDSGTSVRVATGKDIIDYVQDGSIISSTTFSGGGLNDLTPGGSYTGAYTGNYTITVIGNNGARVVFNGGMTTGDQFAVGEIVTGSISGATAVVSNGTNDTRIWVYDVTGTGFVNGDILIGDQGNVSTAVTSAGSAPGVGDLFEVNYIDFTYTQVQWFTGNQAYGTAFPGIGGITYELVTSPTGHTPTNYWTFTASANYIEKQKVNATGTEFLNNENGTTTHSQDIPITNTTKLSSAQILAYDVTPVATGIVVPTGYAIQILDVYGTLTYVTSAYSGSTTINIAFASNPTQSVWQQNNLLLDTATTTRRFTKTSGAAAEVVIPEDSLVITGIAGAPTGGDGTLSIFITYKLIEL